MLCFSGRSQHYKTQYCIKQCVDFNRKDVVLPSVLPQSEPLKVTIASLNLEVDFVVVIFLHTMSSWHDCGGTNVKLFLWVLLQQV